MAMQLGILRWMVVTALLLVFVQATSQVEVSVSATGDVVGPPRHPASIEDETTGPRDDGRTNESPPTQEPSVQSSPAAYLATLQKELESIDRLIELERRKVQTLEELRARALRDANGATADGSEQPQPRELTPTEWTEQLDRRLEQLTTKYTSEVAGTQFETHFIERASIKLDPTDAIVDLQIDILRAHTEVQLVVVAYQSGTIVIYTSTPTSLLTETLRFDTHLKGLTSLQLDTTSDPPHLVAFFKSLTSTSVVTYRFERTEPQQQLTEISRLEYTDPQVRAASAITVARSARRSALAIAQTDGSLAFHAMNGTQFHSLPIATSSPIQFMVSHRKLIAFANATSTVVFSTSRQQRQPEMHVCMGTIAHVTSIAFDPLHQDILYAATRDGELLVYTLTLGPNASSGQACRLTHRTIVQRATPLHIQTIKGYVFAASVDTLYVYSISKPASTYATLQLVCSTPSSTVFTVSESGFATTLGMVALDPQGHHHLTVFHSLLPGLHPTTESNDTPLLRTLWLGGIIVIVVVTVQYFMRKRDATPRTPDREMDKFIAMLDKERRSMGPTSSPYNNPSDHGPIDPQPILNPDRFASRPMGKKPSSLSSRHAPSESYDSLSDEMRRKIAEARRETLECSFEDEEDM